MRAVLLLPFLVSCVTLTPRKTTLSPPDASRQAFRAYLVAECAGERVEASGIVACEDQVHDFAVAVKVPPTLRGRVITAGEDWREAKDFGAGNQDFIPVDGRFNAELRDAEQVVEVRVAALSDAGVVSAKGLLYRHTCSFPDEPCGDLELIVSCEGESWEFGPKEIGVCQRPAGTAQEIGVRIPPDAKAWRLIAAAAAADFETVVTTADDQGIAWVEVPEIPLGPALVSLRLVYDDAGTKIRHHARVLVAGYGPEWIPMDSPRFSRERAFAPVGADVLEVAETTPKTGPTARAVTTASSVKITPDVPACAFAWSVGTMDVTFACRDVPKAPKPEVKTETAPEARLNTCPAGYRPAGDGCNCCNDAVCTTASCGGQSWILK